ncbi:TPA: ComEC family protein [Klebsiella pneumoniae]|uniref:ComEC family protein n=1 Tax=Klebsiella pneumoniae TaxID=573 RepID=UPI000E2DB985|nr:ComEC family protein [Klebsiella pneumoniae]HDS7472905.1 ComEC family protein [Klebsiella pneumoniae subsp. pneumoniae]MCB7721130.1 ComEC family protein [Klebsiella pneumoniae]MCD9763420.1 ComEC family protein [Klebsiella pneumoniae]MCE0017203.1 ComEC family protein [Klebsiella pneumoniae]MDI2615771.1 ComEC family protein [Klebsiella pneumoniae]
MRLPWLAGCAIIAMLPLLWLPVLPGPCSLAGASALALALIRLHGRAVAGVAMTLLLVVWGVLSAHQALWPTRHLTGAIRQAEVILSETDGQTLHRGQMVRLRGRYLFPPVGVTLYGELAPAPACAGQHWLMTLRLRPVHGQLNDGGFDSQRYALAQHRPLSGGIVAASALDARCSLRARYLTSLTRRLQTYPWRAVMLGLGMGERLSLPTEIKVLMQNTGTSHLMAISGLHIALAASLIMLLLRGVQYILPGRWIGWRLPLLAGLAGAVGYAWLTGMQPPALRTCLGLAVCCALRLSGQRWTAWQVWLCCLGAILVADPLAVLSQSLWLSAFAVAGLIFWFQWLPLPAGRWRWPWKTIIALVHLQAGVTLLLLPLQLLLFHGVSLTSMAANLLAVPLVTLLAVPLILTAMLVHLSGPDIVESLLWLAADRVLAVLFWGLRRLPDGWLTLDTRWLWISILPWLLVMGWRFQSWRHSPALCLSVLFLLTRPFSRQPPADEWRVTMLDVGQGLAMVIERHGKALLYDTGPAWPQGDSGQQVIIPWLRWHHLQLQGIMLSHEHLDHRGGLDSVLQAWPQAWVRSPLGWAHHLPCHRGERWQWQGLNFQALWPLPGSTAKGNNHSCVVRIDDGRSSILLTGDIERQAEQAMISRYWRHLTSTLIQVPHHGSNTSSSALLIRRVDGAAALASASRYNAWRMPSYKVVQRYRQRGYRWFATPQQGQITVVFSAEGWQIHSLRDQVLPRWYHQWFGAPADNG